MSAASRAREAAAKAKALAEKYADWPEPGEPDVDPDDIAGHVIKWDFERRLGWFVEHRGEIAEMLGVQEVFLDADHGIGVIK